MGGLSLAALVLLAGCTISPLERVEGGSVPVDSASPSDGSACGTVSYANDIRPWFDLRCSGCHDWTATFMVSNPPSMRKCGPSGAGSNFSSNWRLIAPNDLDNSVILWFVQDCCGNSCLSPPCSSALPKCGSGDPLCQPAHHTTPDERARLECWILEGAPNN